MAWVAPRDWTANEIATAAMLNQDIRDNTKYLKGSGVAFTQLEAPVGFDNDANIFVDVATLDGEESARFNASSQDYVFFKRVSKVWKALQNAVAYYIATPRDIYIPMGDGGSSGSTYQPVWGTRVRVDKASFPYSTVQVALEVVLESAATHISNQAKMNIVSGVTIGAEVIPEMSLGTTAGVLTRSAFVTLPAGENEYVVSAKGSAADGNNQITTRMILRLS